MKASEYRRKLVWKGNRVPYIEIEGRLSEVPALADRVMKILTGA